MYEYEQIRKKTKCVSNRSINFPETITHAFSPKGYLSFCECLKQNRDPDMLMTNVLHI